MKRLHEKVRHVLIFLIIIIMCGSMTANISTAEGSGSNEIKVFLNGERLEFDVNPYIKNSRTLVPFRKIFEAFGLDVQWNPTNKTVLATGKDTQIYLTINNTKGIVNSLEYKLDAPPEIKSSRTFVPLRFIGESIGADVQWEAKTKTVYIKYEGGVSNTVVSNTPTPSADPATTPVPTDSPVYTPAGNYTVGQTATYGDLKFSLDKVELNLDSSDLRVEGKINTEKKLQFNVYADNGVMLFVPAKVVGEKEGDMFKFAGYNFFSADSGVKKIDYIEVRIVTEDKKTVRVAEYRIN